MTETPVTNITTPEYLSKYGLEEGETFHRFITSILWTILLTLTQVKLLGTGDIDNSNITNEKFS